MPFLSPFERKLVRIHRFKISARMGFFFPVFGLTVRNAEPHRRGRSPSGSFGGFTFCRMLDPLGKPENEITAPKPRVSSGSSSKQKATLSKTSATSKHCAQSDRHHDAVMEGIKQLQDQQLASLSSLGTAVHSIVSTVKEFMQFFARAGS